jgi:predicted ATPase
MLTGEIIIRLILKTIIWIKKVIFMRSRLHKISISGFKTIKKLTDFEPGSLTVLIGPNGVGKSNFISFFRLLAWTLQSPGSLQSHIAESGGANALLHDGADITHEIESEMTFKTEFGDNQYSFRLVYGGGDTLFFADEKYRFSSKDYNTLAKWNSLGAGYFESKLIDKSQEGDKTAGVITNLLRKVKVYQFHNTSPTAKMRGKWDVNDDRWLREDAGNIAPFLYRLRQNEPKSYQRIVETIRLILPFMADFELDPNWNRLLLSWREKESDRIFNASQAADGMLRVIALVSLLLQPEADLADVIILDEPELGLHPYAIHIIGGLINSVSKNTQVIIATQSMPLIDCFKPEDLVVVERKGRESEFKRLESQALSSWLDNFSLSELWEKNVIGGRPG